MDRMDGVVDRNEKNSVAEQEISILIFFYLDYDSYSDYSRSKRSN